MWGAILSLLSGIINLIPKVRKWDMQSRAARESDAAKRRIDAALDGDGLSNPRSDRPDKQR